MHIANSTLCIQVTYNDEQNLRVDREVVRRNCPALAPMLRVPGEAGYVADWDHSELIAGLSGESDQRYFTLALNQCDDTYLLENTVN